MQIPTVRVLPFALCLVVAGCASRPLPKYERPLARAQFQSIRTTAYTHTEGDHLQYANRNACGDCLQAGPVNSASCDWSRWPVGTIFRVQETGETFAVDDYGWALSGTNTIDLYKPSRSAMNAWGTRRIHLEILNWGDVDRSLAILEPRTKFAHVRRMVTELKSRYAELTRPFPLGPSSPVASAPPAAAAMPARAAAEAPPAPRAVAVATVAAPSSPGGFAPPSQSRPLLTPFNASAPR